MNAGRGEPIAVGQVQRGATRYGTAYVRWIYRDVQRGLQGQRAGGSAVVGVELTDKSMGLPDLPTGRVRTVIVLGNEGSGIPAEALELLDVANTSMRNG